MSKPDIASLVKAHCPTCGADRLSDVVCYYHRREDDDQKLVWSQVEYRILRCRGCEEVYFQTDRVFSEDGEYNINPDTGEHEWYLLHKITHWPSPSKREKPRWASMLFIVDQDLDSLFDDIYGAINNDLRVMAAIGVRTAFDRASELLGVDPAKNFHEKLTKLLSLGKIGSSEQETLNVLTDAGSAAAHRGWRLGSKELDTMMDILEAFLHRTLVLDAEARALQKLIPEKSKRDKP